MKKVSQQNKLYSILMSENIIERIENETDFLISIIPKIKDMIGFEHNHTHHNLDVWKHTLKALSFAKNIFEVRLALLLHDIGKPHCVQFDGSINHYRGHNKISYDIAKKALIDLEYNEYIVNTVCEIILKHDTPICKSDIEENLELSNLIFEVQKCDVYAHNSEYNEKRIKYLNKTEKLFTNS